MRTGRERVRSTSNGRRYVVPPAAETLTPLRRRWDCSPFLPRDNTAPPSRQRSAAVAIACFAHPRGDAEAPGRQS
jgi:hypothetical protein